MGRESGLDLVLETLAVAAQYGEIFTVFHLGLHARPDLALSRLATPEALIWDQAEALGAAAAWCAPELMAPRMRDWIGGKGPLVTWIALDVCGRMRVEPVTTVDVGLRLGQWAKRFTVQGSRIWLRAAAGWAEMTHDYVCDRHFPPNDLWCGPVRGPIVTEMTILFDALDERGNNPVMADRAAWMHNFARHVIGPIPEYDTWFEATILRLEQHHSWSAEGNPQAKLFDDHFPVGRPLSPKALDPAFPYDPAHAPDLLDRHINRLLRNGNRIVLEPDEHDH